MPRVIRSVFVASAIALACSACSGISSSRVQTLFVSDAICPRERIVVTKRDDITPERLAEVMHYVPDAPTPDVQSDPARMIVWRQKRADAIGRASAFSAYEATGCGKTTLYACRGERCSSFQNETSDERRDRANAIALTARQKPNFHPCGESTFQLDLPGDHECALRVRAESKDVFVTTDRACAERWTTFAMSKEPLDVSSLNLAAPHPTDFEGEHGQGFAKNPGDDVIEVKTWANDASGRLVSYPSFWLKVNRQSSLDGMCAPS